MSESPRERLLRRGAQSLSNEELLAVLFQTGRRRASAIKLARDVLQDLGGLAGLRSVLGNLDRQPDIGKVQAATLLAAVELGCRLARSELEDGKILDEPGVVAKYLGQRYGTEDQTILGALFLDVRHQLIAEREIFRGTLYRSAVEPRTILKEALQLSAASLILFHTRPGGEASPSQEDLAFTRRMVEAGRLLDIRIADHLILGGEGRWVSLARRGALRWHESE